jgi:hypothetical protein
LGAVDARPAIEGPPVVALRPPTFFLARGAQHLASLRADVAPRDVVAAALGLGAFTLWALALSLLGA